MFKPCVFEYSGIKLDGAHGFIPGPTEYWIGSYCDICGKVGPGGNRWFQWVPYNGGSFGKFEPTEEAKRQLDPETRTLPTFHLDNVFQKAVNLGNYETTKGWFCER